MFRIGHGYDVHRLVEDRKLWICGVEVEHTLGLLGHSDADVALHALCDAILGALALGDIGMHFPDTDPRYKGIDSRKLLAEVCRMMTDAVYRLGYCDITIFAQRQKLRPYIDRMREEVARITDSDKSQVSVKATTEEGLGFTGTEQGISATAVVLLYLNDSAM